MAQKIFSLPIKRILLAVALAVATRPLLGGAAIAADGLAQATARLSGRVTVAGRYPTPKALPVFKNRTFCGPQVVNETLIVGNNGGLKNTVVILRAIDRTMAVKPSQLILDNQHCAFAPHVQVAPVGSQLLLKNSDSILHTVHARLGRETLFNVGLPMWRQVTKRLDRAGVVRIDCDVLHTWMSAAIVVTQTPFFALTDGAGNFRIDGLPAGNYELEAWHEKLGTKTIGVTVNRDSVLSLEIVYGANGYLR